MPYSPLSNVAEGSLGFRSLPATVGALFTTLVIALQHKQLLHTHAITAFLLWYKQAATTVRLQFHHDGR